MLLELFPCVALYCFVLDAQSQQAHVILARMSIAMVVLLIVVDLVGAGCCFNMDNRTRTGLTQLTGLAREGTAGQPGHALGHPR